ncbi:restriction endonuclease subunit S [endosymbiont GvMRE of Glomus versiforme]|uniref:restriction endonuclease subunit S n=1 Tax=endosymbiont GvMRE of Glomus versiforme TaxID=2039283 RepID=UPI000ECD0C1D|nr:restriction endonuclease subunit S [endosymbiont GvMRE of Glomus versiforme]RHZ37158.1 Type I restriction modification DNA specificity domain protein [endosymbiont GvMRE of Glomus versiforme]
MEKVYKLGEICSIRSGITPSTNNKSYWCLHKKIQSIVGDQKCDCIPWFTGKDIKQKNILNTERKITPLAIKEYKMNLTTENSILFNYLECSPYYLGIKGISCQGGGGTHILEPNLELVYPNYLYYLLLAEKKRMRKWRSGTAQLKIRGQELVKLEVSLPSLPQQNQILQKFQIVYNSRVFQSEIIYNDNVLRTIKVTLEWAKHRFLKYKDSEIKIKDKFKLVAGKTPSTKIKEYYENGTIKWINSGVLTNLYFLTKTLPTNYITKKAVEECNLPYAKPNSVLISRVDFNIDDKIVWNQTDNFTIGDSIRNFLGNSKEANATLFFALLSARPKTINKICLKGATQFTLIRSSELVNFPLWWVSNPNKQKIFFTILNSKLAKIKDLLLLKYFG